MNVGNGEVSTGSWFQALAEEDQDDHHDPVEEIQAMESAHAPLGVEGMGMSEELRRGGYINQGEEHNAPRNYPRKECYTCSRIKFGRAFSSPKSA